jgi:hypothetical protein
MLGEEVFVQQFAKLFVHYRDALTVDTAGEHGSELQRLNEMPAVELDRMVSAARLALLEIESDARERGDTRHYYANPGDQGRGSNGAGGRESCPGRS